MQTPRAPVLWDIFTRLFHWIIVICVPLAWWSGEEGNYTVHQWTGYTVLVLVVTRIIWGLIGSRHSRFSDFLKGPRATVDYIRGGQGGSAGHNPLGGWSVIVLLCLLLAQAVSGLFNSDDILYTGPLYYAADADTRGLLAQVHEYAFNGLLFFIALHILAVFYYQFVRRAPLLQAMIFGKSGRRQGAVAPVPVWRAIILLVVVAGLFWLVLANAPEPPAFW